MQPQTAVETGKWLGETWGFWVQTGALIISAAAAIWLIRDNERGEQLRATVELVLRQKQDQELQDALKYVRSLRENKIGNLAKFLENKESDECQKILRVLNNYEFIASGIKEGAFCEDLFKRMQYSVFVYHWKSLHGFVAEFRNQNGLQTLFQEFEHLATRWESNRLKQY